MLVSVIVPVYNSEKYIAEALDSILASDYTNIEVVCVDDGSKDNSLEILKKYASKDDRVRVYSQANAGACAARNYAISLSKGELILPVDSDNKITSTFISRAVDIMVSDIEIKVVAPRAMFFGDRLGEWKLPLFSLNLLARKNIIDTCAMYRKSDWVRIGGYDVDMIAREDWGFWIAMLKNGGRVVRLDEISLYYRVREKSKRISDREKKHHIIDVLNKKHPEFFERELGGPLRYHRTWSKFINKISRVVYPRRVKVSGEYEEMIYWIKSLLVRWKNGEGIIIHNKRNELREMNINGIDVVVKSFAIPNIINRIVYGLFRKSKAQRSYEYAVYLNKVGINSPNPIAYYTERCGLFFANSYYVSEKSRCRYTFYNVIDDKSLENRDLYLQYVGAMTAKMHKLGIYPLDYSGGNILLDVINGEPRFELVDLNRMKFGKVDMDKGCRCFERLNVESEALEIMAREYARVRGYDEKECVYLVQKYRWYKHQK